MVTQKFKKKGGKTGLHGKVLVVQCTGLSWGVRRPGSSHGGIVHAACAGIDTGYFRQTDLVLLALCCIATAFGILMIYSATRYMNTLRLVLVQTGGAVIGIILFSCCPWWMSTS